MKTMDKAYFASVLVRKMGLKRTEAKQMIDIFFSVLKEAVIQSDRVEIRGFGAWRIKETNPRPNARNPKTGETVSVPAKRKVMFKPGKILRGALSRP